METDRKKRPRGVFLDLFAFVMLSASIGFTAGATAGYCAAMKLERAAIWRMRFVDDAIKHVPARIRAGAQRCVARHERGDALSLDWLRRCARS
jgi:hypothetical protein